MTGTINPDGSAGPVSGIVQRCRGRAKRAQAFRLSDWHAQPQGPEDGQYRRSHGRSAEPGTRSARAQRSPTEAYAFITTDKLPRVDPVAEAEMDRGGQAKALLRTKLAVWKTRIDSELAVLKTATASAGGPLRSTKSFLDDGQLAYDTAQRYERDGIPAPALENYALSVAYISVARRFTEAATLARRNNFGGLVKGLNDASSINADIKAFSDELESTSTVPHARRPGCGDRGLHRRGSSERRGPSGRSLRPPRRKRRSRAFKTASSV